MATLAEIRTDVLRFGGRHDLSAGNKIDFFIQAGQRYLDTILPNPDSVSEYKKDIAAGDGLLTTENVRTIEKVSIADGTDVCVLEEKQFDELKADYPEPVGSITNSTPLYWARARVLLAPQQRALTSVSYTGDFTHDGEENIFTTERHKQNGIILRPTADKAYTVIVTGQFFSVLEADSDETYHSVKWPELLMLATQYTIEKFYRNQQGMIDARIAMNDLIDAIDYESVEDDMSYAGNQLKG
jgi:hypothetical protein